MWKFAPGESTFIICFFIFSTSFFIFSSSFRRFFYFILFSCFFVFIAVLFLFILIRLFCNYPFQFAFFLTIFIRITFFLANVLTVLSLPFPPTLVPAQMDQLGGVAPELGRGDRGRGPDGLRGLPARPRKEHLSCADERELPLAKGRHRGSRRHVCQEDRVVLRLCEFS